MPFFFFSPNWGGSVDASCFSVCIFWEVVSVCKSHVGVPLALSHSHPSINHRILKKGITLTCELIPTSKRATLPPLNTRAPLLLGKV